MRKKSLLKYLLLALISVLSFSCSDSEVQEDGLLIRSVRNLKIVADSTDSKSGYNVEWVAPGDQDGLLSYHLWIHIDDFKSDLITTGEVKEEYFKSNSNWEYFGPLTDKDKSGSINPFWAIPDSVLQKILDQKLDSIKVSVFAKYNSGNEGLAPVQTLYLRDVFPADLVGYNVLKGPDSLFLSFEKPQDLTQLVPLKRDGFLAGYEIKISKVGKTLEKPVGVSLAFNHGKIILGKKFPGLSTADTLTQSDLIESDLPNALSYVILEDNKEGIRQLKIKGLTPLAKYEIQIESLDLLGNREFVDGKSINLQIDTLSTTTLIAPKFTGSIKLKYIESHGLEVSFPTVIKGDELVAYPERFELVAIDTADGFNDTLTHVLNVGMNVFNDSLKDTIPYLFDHRSYDVKVFVVDSSGHYGLGLDSVLMATDVSCPKGYASVDDFCMSIFEAKLDSGIISDLRAPNAQSYCQGMSDTSYDFDLCEEDQWVDACHSDFDSDSLTQPLTHGVLLTEELESTLFQICGLGSGDKNLNNLKCVNRQGIRNLPSSRQEWVKSVDTSGAVIKDAFKIKGSSYLVPRGQGISVLADYSKCEASSKGAVLRDSIAIFFELKDANGNIPFDTLIQLINGGITYFSDTNYTEKQRSRVFTKEDYTSKHIVYEVLDNSVSLGYDTLNLNSFLINPNYLASISRGYDYVAIDTLTSYLLSTKTKEDPFYKAAQVGFRCCARKK